MASRFYVATFGCRTNQADSVALRDEFLDAGLQEAPTFQDADVIVVNSCTVTHRSDQQVRQLTRRFRRGNPRARIVVAGCYAQRDPQRVAAIEGIDAVVGNSHKDQLVRISVGETGPSGDVEATGDRASVRAAVFQQDFPKVRSIDALPADRVGTRTRPLVKIQDGCDSRCTYCIIPKVRGPSRSVPPDQILGQVGELIDQGFREIVLTGIHMGTYGRHLSPRFPLDRLLEEIVVLPGLGQVRLSSIEPMELSRRVIELAATTARIAPHFHVCLQSGSDRILRQMLRPYRTSRFLDLVEEIRSLIPHAGIGTDVIVGFPGETEEDHRQTLEFVARAPFTYVHVFPYSDRNGTAASGLADKVPPQAIRRRAAEVRQLSDEKNRCFRELLVGETVSLLTLTEIEGRHRRALTGNYLDAEVAAHCPGNILTTGVVSAIRAGRLKVELPDRESEGLAQVSNSSQSSL